jgi:hypothetical protein
VQPAYRVASPCPALLLLDCRQAWFRGASLPLASGGACGGEAGQAGLFHRPPASCSVSRARGQGGCGQARWAAHSFRPSCAADELHLQQPGQHTTGCNDFRQRVLDTAALVLINGITCQGTARLSQQGHKCMQHMLRRRSGCRVLASATFALPARQMCTSQS